MTRTSLRGCLTLRRNHPSSPYYKELRPWTTRSQMQALSKCRSYETLEKPLLSVVLRNANRTIACHPGGEERKLALSSAVWLALSDSTQSPQRETLSESSSNLTRKQLWKPVTLRAGPAVPRRTQALKEQRLKPSLVHRAEHGCTPRQGVQERGRKVTLHLVRERARTRHPSLSLLKSWAI